MDSSALDLASVTLGAYICIYSMSQILGNKVYYTAGEVAKLAGVHRLTLLRWIREGRLTDAARDRNGWRIFSEELTQQVVEFSKSVNQRSSPNQQILFARATNGSPPK
jgi:excisionase family DNA binding protein